MTDEFENYIMAFLIICDCCGRVITIPGRTRLKARASREYSQNFVNFYLRETTKHAARSIDVCQDCAKITAKGVS